MHQHLSVQEIIQHLLPPVKSTTQRSGAAAYAVHHFCVVVGVRMGFMKPDRKLQIDNA